MWQNTVRSNTSNTVAHYENVLYSFVASRSAPSCGAGSEGGGRSWGSHVCAARAFVASVRERGRHGRGRGGGGARWRGGLRGCRDVLELSGAVPAAVSLHAGEELDERSERARLLQGRVPPLLPVQPVRRDSGATCPGGTRSAATSSTGSELPVAIPEQGDEMIFSGSAVVDKDNTSGFGTPGRTRRWWRSTRAAQPGLAGAVAGLQHRPRPDLDQVRRQSGARHRLGRVPRPEGVLVRAGARVE